MSEKTNKNGLVIIVVAVVLVLAGAGAIYYTSMDNSANTNMTNMASDNETVSVGGEKMYKDRDIIDNVVNAPNLTTLVSAVQAAELVEALKSPGPFTVFGPDNAAFEKLPAGTVNSLLLPSSKDDLQNILKYHVVSGRYTSADLTNGQSLETLNGQKLTVQKTGNSVALVDANGNKSTVKTADVLQSNGVAHVVDSVLLPDNKVSKQVGGAPMLATRNIVDNVTKATNLTTLVAAVQAADLVSTLQGPGPFTVFGPDNAAFEKLPAGTVDTLLKPENKARLTGVLTYHVVSGNLKTTDLEDGEVLKTVNGQNLTVVKSNGKVQLRDANGGLATITNADVPQSNGMAHVIDSVLLPA